MLNTAIDRCSQSYVGESYKIVRKARIVMLQLEMCPQLTNSIVQPNLGHVKIVVTTNGSSTPFL